MPDPRTRRRAATEQRNRPPHPPQGHRAGIPNFQASRCTSNARFIRNGVLARCAGVLAPCGGRRMGLSPQFCGAAHILPYHLKLLCHRTIPGFVTVSFPKRGLFRPHHRHSSTLIRGLRQVAVRLPVPCGMRFAVLPRTGSSFEFDNTSSTPHVMGSEARSRLRV